MSEDEIIGYAIESCLITSTHHKGFYRQALLDFGNAIKKNVKERQLENCASLVEQMGMSGYGTLAIAAAIREEIRK